MGSSILDSLGQMHISTGLVTYTSGVPALSNNNDATVTVADTGTGIATLTFGEPFLSTPHAMVSYYKLTHEDQTAEAISVEAISTTTLAVRMQGIVDSGADTTDVANADPADGDGFIYTVIGKRNN